MGMETIHQSVFELPMEIGDVNHCGTTALLMGQGEEVSLRLHSSHCLMQVPSFTPAPSSERMCWVSFPQFSCSAGIILPTYSPHPKKEKWHPKAYGE